jgi:hypothetical protein
MQLVLQAIQLRSQHRIGSPQPVMFVANHAHDETLTHAKSGRNTQRIEELKQQAAPESPAPACPAFVKTKRSPAEAKEAGPPGRSPRRPSSDAQEDRSPSGHQTDRPRYWPHGVNISDVPHFFPKWRDFNDRTSVASLGWYQVNQTLHSKKLLCVLGAMPVYSDKHGGSVLKNLKIITK